MNRSGIRHPGALAASALISLAVLTTEEAALALNTGVITLASYASADAAPAAGEEAVAFTAVAPLVGVDTRWKAVVFRSGATLAHFTFANAGSMVSGGDFAFPAELVTAQAKKLA
ncbi:hypothetical protein ACWCPF_16080 [Streptomyces sp. NPDC001858]